MTSGLPLQMSLTSLISVGCDLTKEDIPVVAV